MKVCLDHQIDYELVFVNDGSSDNTLEQLRKLSNQDKSVTYLSLSRNFGKGAAMFAGFCNVSGDYVAVMDAGLQDPFLPDYQQNFRCRHSGWCQRFSPDEKEYGRCDYFRDAVIKIK